MFCWKCIQVLLLTVVVFGVGVISANHCPMIAHLSGGPCAKIRKGCCSDECCCKCKKCSCCEACPGKCKSSCCPE